MTEHRDSRWWGHPFERARRGVGRLGVTSGAIVLFVLFGLLSSVYAINEAAAHRRDDRDEQCLVQLQQLQTSRAKALTTIQDDDRRAQATLNARWARDVVTGNIRDIPKAYEAFRVEFNENQVKRQRYGVGITVTSACQFRVVKATAGAVLPSNSATRSAAPSSLVSSLPPLPSVVFVTRTQTVPGPTAVSTVTVTETVRPGRVTLTATVMVTRTWTARPGLRPTATRTVTVTKTLCVLPSPVPSVPAVPCQ